MIENDLVTVIITTYKRRVSQIKKAIESVLNQTYQNLELIIVDDSPVDFIYRNEVKDFCETIADKRVQYVQHKKNLGACMARNTGLYLCKGKYVSFLDDDDEYLPKRIEEMIKLFQFDTVLVYCNANIIDLTKSNIKKDFFKNNQQYKGLVYHQIMKSNFIGSTSMALIRTSVLKKIGGFDVEMEASQDWEVWIRLCKEGAINYTNKSLINYYIYKGERITNDTKRRLRALKCLNEKNKEYLNQNNDVYVERKIYEMRLSVQSYDLKNAWRCYVQIVKAEPIKVVKNIIILKAFGRLIIRKTNA